MPRPRRSGGSISSEHDYVGGVCKGTDGPVKSAILPEGTLPSGALPNGILNETIGGVTDILGRTGSDRSRAGGPSGCSDRATKAQQRRAEETMTERLGSVPWSFEVNESWAKVPDEIVLGDCAAVGVDSKDNVYA